ncbi:hypothetical protein [Kineosporia babensis]|uniref:Uncharacterized protein n=1 Tax=Kineosporia babensis TaxID=499548 RepID=A0A9X1N947_9ACTN|nr:hypothetical protein [Kineosporia babensis]MCD5310802.1 hypothetical protein [Kineosporia babensis]
MSTAYPHAVDVFPDRHDGPTSVIRAGHINDLQDAITAVQETLGVNPANGSASVADRLSQMGVIHATADQPLSSPLAVTFTETGHVRPISAFDPADAGQLVMVTWTAAAEAGDEVALITGGSLPWPAGGLTPGQALYLRDAGQLSPLPPIGAAFLQIIAVALEPDLAWVAPQALILM